VELFQRGEEVAYEAPAEEEVKAVVVTKPPAPVPVKAPTKPVTPAPIKPKSQPISAKAKTFAPAKTAFKPKAAVSQLTSLSSSSSTAKQKAAQAASEKALNDKPQPPQKGKAKVECGCFGNKHKALANCLHCGRVSCQAEGYDFCPFCEYLVQPVQVPAEGMYVQRNQTALRSSLYYYHSAFRVSHSHLLLFPLSFDISTEAWARKERLLQYDGESAERTVVLDDQADHFNSQDSAWLTEEERANAKERSDARSDAMNHRGKVQLNIEL
jgi:predicted nucleic acid binding AN1-type Zn finger protein